MKTASHTPTPWHINGNPAFSDLILSGGSDVMKNEVLARCDFENFSREEAQANAAFIVRAVNSHYALVSALNRAVSQLKFLQSQHADAWAEDEEKDVMDTFEQGKKALSLANS